MTQIKSITRDDLANPSLRKAIIKCLLEDRMSNYGYDYRHFNTMSQHRTKLRKLLRIADHNKLNWDNLDYKRFAYDSNSSNKVTYITCQSNNEEITQRMEELLAK